MIIKAYLLHSHNIGNTSLSITLFTQDSGIMRLLYKSGVLAKNRALLQYFQLLWVDYSERYSRFYLRSIEHVSLPHRIQDISLSSAWYVNELMYVTQYPGQSEPMLYDAYEIVLRDMSAVTDRISLERSLRRFERVLLKSLGHDIVLTHTIEDQQIQHDHQYTFIPGSGFTLADPGISGSYLLAFAADLLDDPKVLSAAKHIMRRSIDHALDGRVLKTRTLGLSMQYQSISK